MANSDAKLIYCEYNFNFDWKREKSFELRKRLKKAFHISLVHFNINLLP